MIEFNGIDMIVLHRMADTVVCRGLTAALHVPESRVALIDDVSDYPESGDADVFCVSSSVDGEFTVCCLFKPIDSRCPMIRVLS
jgi:hypothetical protein